MCHSFSMLHAHEIKMIDWLKINRETALMDGWKIIRFMNKFYSLPSCFIIHHMISMPIPEKNVYVNRKLFWNWEKKDAYNICNFDCIILIWSINLKSKKEKIIIFALCDRFHFWFDWIMMPMPIKRTWIERVKWQTNETTGKRPKTEREKEM